MVTRIQRQRASTAAGSTDATDVERTVVPITRHHAVDAEDDAHVESLKSFTTGSLPDPFTSQSFGGITGSTDIVAPPYNLWSLVRLPNENDSLRTCIAAMTTNVVGHGYSLTYIGDEGRESCRASRDEREAITGLLDHPCPDQTGPELLHRLWTDLETTGNAYVEAGRNSLGQVDLLAHLPSHTVRMTPRDKGTTEAEVYLPRGRGKPSTQKVKRRFRRFVQVVGTSRTYFREFGDPRRVNADNGKAGGDVPDDKRASEIIHLSIYDASSPYGIPRWLPQMPSVLGSRQAEMVNLSYFRENAIPALAVLVSGGFLTQESVDRLDQALNAAPGLKSQNRVIVVEAEADDSLATDKGGVPPVKVDLQPLAGARPQDHLFGEFQKAASNRVRFSFRLPPIFLGQSDDYTYATAAASYEVAEGQVFRPERGRVDDMFNVRILPTLNARFWKVSLNRPKIADDAKIIEAIEAADSVGAMTPNRALRLLEPLFGTAVAPITEPWGDQPFALALDAAAEGRTSGAQDLKDKTDGIGKVGGKRKMATAKRLLANDPQAQMALAGLVALGAVAEAARAAEEATD